MNEILVTGKQVQKNSYVYHPWESKGWVVHTNTGKGLITCLVFDSLYIEVIKTLHYNRKKFDLILSLIYATYTIGQRRVI